MLDFILMQVCEINIENFQLSLLIFLLAVIMFSRFYLLEILALENQV